MDANVKRQLDLRLAKGEISKEEYLSISQTVAQNAHSEPFSLSSLVSKVKGALFDKYQMVVPSDDTPLMVNDEFCLYSAGLVYKGRQVLYSQIISLGYQAKQEFVNGSLTAYDAKLWILPSAGGSISVSASLTHMGFGKIAQKKVKCAENAYLFLRQITFQQRLSWNLRELETKGYIDLSGPGQDVKLYRQGYIRKGDLSINLREAHQKNLIQFGTSGLFSMSPTTVIFGQSGTTFLSRRIVVGLWIDNDVLRLIILWLAGAYPT